MTSSTREAVKFVLWWFERARTTPEADLDSSRTCRPRDQAGFKPVTSQYKD